MSLNAIVDTIHKASSVPQPVLQSFPELSLEVTGNSNCATVILPSIPNLDSFIKKWEGTDFQPNKIVFGISEPEHINFEVLNTRNNQLRTPRRFKRPFGVEMVTVKDLRIMMSLKRSQKVWELMKDGSWKILGSSDCVSLTDQEKCYRIGDRTVLYS